jgi:2-iminobutanoate/2-iminopropanoate deaminase
LAELEISQSPLPFSPAVRAGAFLLVSGQASVDATGRLVSDTFEGEMRRSLSNVVAILATVKMTLKDVVRVQSYLGREEDVAEYNRIYREYFGNPLPARTTLLGVLGTRLKFEMDVTAYPGGPRAV